MAASQAVYVDLDLKNLNHIINLADPVEEQDAATKAYVDDAVAGVGITGYVTTETYEDGQAAQDAVIDTKATIAALNTAVSTLEGADTTLQENIDAEAAARASADDILQDNIDAIPEVVKGTGVTVTTTGTGATATTTVAVDEAWLVDVIKDKSANNLTAGGGITITPGADEGDPDTVAAKVSGTTGNQLTIDVGGLFVPKTDLTGYYTKIEVDTSQAAQNTAITNNATAISNEATARGEGDAGLQEQINALEITVGAIDYPVKDVEGATDQIKVVETVGEVFTVSIEPAYTTARDAYADGKVAAEADLRVAGDEALDGKIDGVAGDLAAEVDRATAAEGALDTKIDGVAGDLADEVARATAAEGALQGEIDAEESARAAADTALGGRIDNLSIVGTGMVKVTPETGTSGDGTWSIDVPAIQLANTYTGTEADPNVGIGSGINIQPGDLYINTASNVSYIATSLGTTDGEPAPNWTELVQPTAAVTSIAGTLDQVLIDGSVTADTGSVVVSLAPAITSAIATATATNGTQQTDIDALKVDKHVAATGAGAISVNGAGQVVSLVIDGSSTSGVLSQTATGLKVDVSDYAKGADLTILAGRVATNEGDIAGIKTEQGTQNTAIAANDTAIKANASAIAALEAGQTAQNNAITANDTAIKANATAISTLNTSQAAQDAKITALEGLHVSKSVDFGAGGGSTVIEGPVGRTVTVRDNGGCVVTLSVCETAAGQYTVASNLLFSGTITFG